MEWRKGWVEGGGVLPPTELQDPPHRLTFTLITAERRCDKREWKVGTNFEKWGPGVSLEVRFDKWLLFSLTCRLNFQTGPTCMKKLSQLELF